MALIKGFARTQKGSDFFLSLVAFKRPRGKVAWLSERMMILELIIAQYNWTQLQAPQRCWIAPFPKIIIILSEVVRKRIICCAEAWIRPWANPTKRFDCLGDLMGIECNILFVYCDLENRVLKPSRSLSAG